MTSKKTKEPKSPFGSIEDFKNVGNSLNLNNTPSKSTSTKPSVDQEAFKMVGNLINNKKKAEYENQLQTVRQPINAVAGFLDSNGIFHPLQPNPEQMPRQQADEPLKVEDRLNCPCLNCKFFGNHNPTQEERKKVLVTYAQLIAGGIFILGMIIIILKLYIFH